MAGVVRRRRGRWVGKLMLVSFAVGSAAGGAMLRKLATGRGTPTTAATRPDAVGSSATAATASPSDSASAAVERPIATKRQPPSGARSAWMRRAALGEAATTACSRPAAISAFASAAVSTAGGRRRCPASAPGGGLAGGQAAARIGRVIHGVVGGDGLDGRAPGRQAPAEPGVGDVRLRQQHAALAFAARFRAGRRRTGGRSGPGRRRFPRASSTRRVAGPIVATWTLPGSQLLSVHAALGGLGLQRLDGGHAADHQPGVGAGTEGVEGDIEGMLVPGQLEVDQRQQQRIGAGLRRAATSSAARSGLRATRTRAPLGHRCMSGWHRSVPVAVAAAVP